MSQIVRVAASLMSYLQGLTIGDGTIVNAENSSSQAHALDLTTQLSRNLLTIDGRHNSGTLADCTVNADEGCENQPSAVQSPTKIVHFPSSP